MKFLVFSKEATVFRFKPSITYAFSSRNVRKGPTLTPRQQAGPVRLAFVLALILTAGGVAAFGQASNERTEKVYWVEKITEDGKIILREYEVTSTQILDFPDLEIWGKAFGRSDPFFMQRGKILDVKSLLLQTGLPG